MSFYYLPGDWKRKRDKYPGGVKESLRCTMAASRCCCLSGWTLILHIFHVYITHTHTKKNQATLRRNKNCLTLPKCWLILLIVRHLPFFFLSTLLPSRPILYSSSLHFAAMESFDLFFCNDNTEFLNDTWPDNLWLPPPMGKA